MVAKNRGTAATSIGRWQRVLDHGTVIDQPVATKWLSKAASASVQVDEHG
jgi:hypothetical protein